MLNTRNYNPIERDALDKKMNLPEKIVICSRCGEKIIYIIFGNLQGSQTSILNVFETNGFYSYHNLQGSQTTAHILYFNNGFTLIIIYKVLKL